MGGRCPTAVLLGHFCLLRLRAGPSVFVRPVRLSVCRPPSLSLSLFLSLSVLLAVCLLALVVCLPMCLPLCMSAAVLVAASASACLLGKKVTMQ